jgi:hypothetical protein
MKNIPLIDELHATRQRLAHEQELDVERYAAMLSEVARTAPGHYVTKPFLPLVEAPRDTRARNAG